MISVLYLLLFLKLIPFISNISLSSILSPKQVGFDGQRVTSVENPPEGLHSRCSFCHFQMHPCCAMLSDQINYPSLHNHPLYLLPSLASDDQLNFNCRDCNRKRSGRLYGCMVCDYHLHAVCAKDLINGLKVNGIKNSEHKASVLGPAMRFASQAVAEFIGGLIDGIGEGVGEALVQNVAKEWWP